MKLSNRQQNDFNNSQQSTKLDICEWKSNMAYISMFGIIFVANVYECINLIMYRIIIQGM